MTKRIQLRRVKGWKKPDGTVVVTRPGPWGNPYYVRGYIPLGERVDNECQVTSHEHAVELYIRLLRRRPDLVERIRRSLAGRDVACWCRPDAVCHGDVLLRVAAGGQP